MLNNEKQTRLAIVEQSRRLCSSGLNQGTSGNVSVRLIGHDIDDLNRVSSSSLAADEAKSAILITPSSIDYSIMRPEMIAHMSLDGAWTGPNLPSSEWRFHTAIMKARADVNAIVHTHSHYATVLSMTHQEIPPCHYLIALFGGSNVRCTPFTRFGSQQLADFAVAALAGRLACLLANHGAIAVGNTLAQAVDNAIQLETLAKQYYHAKLLGNLVLLTEAQVQDTMIAIEQLSARCEH